MPDERVRSLSSEISLNSRNPPTPTLGYFVIIRLGVALAVCSPLRSMYRYPPVDNVRFHYSGPPVRGPKCDDTRVRVPRWRCWVSGNGEIQTCRHKVRLSIDAASLQQPTRPIIDHTLKLHNDPSTSLSYSCKPHPHRLVITVAPGRTVVFWRLAL